MTNVLNLSTSTKPAPISWVESLFARMHAIYANKFVDKWRDTDLALVKAMWAEEMGKLTSEELKRGYNALMSRDWPPDLPEYVKMCRPPIDSMSAYYEAVNGVSARERGEMGTWTHPAIYWAAVKLAFDLKSMTHAAIKDRWNRALAEEMEKGEWVAIPAPMVALAAPGKTVADKEHAEKMVKELKAEAVVKPRNDEKRWAKRIIERVKRGDKTVSQIQRQFAEEAMKASAA